MNLNEMTAAQCADWLAAKDGYVNVGVGCDFWMHHTNPTVQVPPPYPLTLDAAAGALREPFYWHEIIWRYKWDGDVRKFSHVEVCMRKGEYTVAEWAWTTGHDELTARYRAAVAAKMEDGNG